MAAACEEHREEISEKKVFCTVTDDGILNLSPEVRELRSENEIRIVAICGDARKGKSTFLNCVASKLRDKNSDFFPAKDDDSHCTHGIDFVFLKEHGLILLDCQGLRHEDSKNDTKLLLFVYMVSDVIVLNERNILQNSTLELLQPAVSFLNFFDVSFLRTHRPDIIFRISDKDLRFDDDDHLKKLLSRKDDQYQAVREAVDNLFHKKLVTSTKTLSRDEKKMLELHSYFNFLKIEESDFSSSINIVLSCLEDIKKKDITAWVSTVNVITETINANEKIDFKKLDIYNIIAEREIHEYIAANVPRGIYIPLTVDGTTNDEQLIEERETQYIEQVFELDRVFSYVSESSRKPIERIKTEITDLIETAKRESFQKACRLYIAEILEKCGYENMNFKTIDAFQKHLDETYIPKMREHKISETFVRHCIENIERIIAEYKDIVKREITDTIFASVVDITRKREEFLDSYKRKLFDDIYRNFDVCKKTKTLKEEMLDFYNDVYYRVNCIELIEHVVVSVDFNNFRITETKKHTTHIDKLESHDQRNTAFLKKSVFEAEHLKEVDKMFKIRFHQYLRKKPYFTREEIVRSVYLKEESKNFVACFGGIIYMTRRNYKRAINMNAILRKMLTDCAIIRIGNNSWSSMNSSIVLQHFYNTRSLIKSLTDNSLIVGQEFVNTAKYNIGCYFGKIKLREARVAEKKKVGLVKAD